MGDKINITLQQRELQGKKVARLRKEGLVPGIVYGHGFDPIMVQAEYNLLEKVARDAGKHSPVHATIGSKKRITLIKDVDRSSVNHRIRHISFHAVSANEIVTAEVPIHLTGVGESEAEKVGLIILQAIEAIEIKAKPADLPESLEVSIAELASPEDKILLSDLTLPKDVEFADAEQDLELAVASVYEPAALEAANDAAAGEATDEAGVAIEGEEATAEAPAAEPEKEA